MIEYLEDYEGNALAITDEQVQSDWRFGLVRGAARVIEREGLPTQGRGRYNSVIPDSPLAHIKGTYVDGVLQKCSLTEIYSISDDGGQIFLEGTMGGQTLPTMVLKAKASCACGELVRVAVEATMAPYELIYKVMSS